MAREVPDTAAACRHGVPSLHASGMRGLTKRAREVSGSGALVLQRYEKMVADGVLRPDRRQHGVIRTLAVILSALVDGLPAHEGVGGGKGADAKRKVKGLYVHGEVGSGKSMAMNLFFEAARELLPQGAVRRVHFHEFMLQVHAQLHKYKEAAPRGSPRAIPAVAKLKARDARVLCLDEFQVTDIADAAILAQLMDTMWRAGVCVIATSNRAPCQLYKDGLNRHVYLPKFEKALAKYCVVHDLTSGDHSAGAPVIDYRVGGHPIAGLYILSAGSAREKHTTSPALRRTWDAIVGVGGGGIQVVGEGKVGGSSVAVGVGFGRHVSAELTVKQGRVRAAWFAASELFDSALGAVDYLALTKEFDVVVVSGLAAFDLRRHNEARRFMCFVDILYDEGCLVVLEAQSPVHELLRLVDEKEGGQELGHRPPSNSSDSGEVTVNLHVKGEGGASSSGSTTYINDTEWSSTGRIGVSMAALSGVRDVTFSKERAISRLIEMQCAGYLSTRPRCSPFLPALQTLDQQDCE